MSTGEVVRALLATKDEEALERALSAASPVVVAQAVSAAMSLERKTELLWALDDRSRREVLELVPPALVGALVQNLEEDNRYLLGDVSLLQFRALLALCSPERKYYWLTTALSFTDARANALPLLVPTRELVEVLLTRADFEEQLHAIAAFPIEDQRLPPELMAEPIQAMVDLFGPENLLRQFPVADPGLVQFLQTLLEYDPDRYVDVVREGLRLLDYRQDHPDEWRDLTEEPVLLNTVEPIEVLPEDARIPEGGSVGVGEPEFALVPVVDSALARVARPLPATIQRRVADDLQFLLVRQAIAEGGSFLVSDLQRIARSVEAYLLLGLEAESGYRPERESVVLAVRSLQQISQSGARVLEPLRQIALRAEPLRDVLDAPQKALLRSIIHPRLTIEKGMPRLQILPGEGLPDVADVAETARLLQAVVAWTEIARAVGASQVAAALRAGRTVSDLLEELTLAAVLYAHVEVGLVAASDWGEFARRYQDGGAVEARAAVRLERVVTDWADGRGLDPGMIRLLFNKALPNVIERSVSS